MTALGTVVRAGTGRRRVQTLVMVLTTMTAVAACLLAAGLLVAAQGPYEHAFARQQGAHLAVRYDPALVEADGLAATGRVPGVTAVAGPYPAVALEPHVGENRSFLPPGGALAPMTLVGRPQDGPLDRLRVTLGRWVAGPGEVVLPDGASPLALGDRMVFPDLPGRPVLTVVGLAASVSRTADGWVAPEEIPELTAPGTAPAPQLLYRFARADTRAEVEADRDALAAVVRPGALTAATSYLPAKQAANRTAATFVPFVIAFGVLGLAMSVLVIGTVVGGAVAAATRRIGILKAVGFTPAQVARAYVGQALLPAAVGTLLGVLVGNALAVPVLGVADKALRSGLTGVDPWIDLAVPAGALGVVAATALVPALRAARLRTVEALAVGRPASAGGGRWAQGLLARLPLPRAVGLGLAGPLTRPARSATTAAAVLLGTVGVTLGTGLAISLDGFQDGLNRDSAGSVQVAFAQPGSTPTGKADEDGVAAAIAGLPGTRGWFGTGLSQVGVAGKPDRTAVIAYRGDSSWGAYQLVSGRWFHGPGEVVAPSGFLTAFGLRVGDSVGLTEHGRDVPVRIVGEALSLHEGLLTDRATLAALDARVLPDSVRFDVDLAPGTDRQAYLDSLNRALAPYGVTAVAEEHPVSLVVVAMGTLALLLTVLVVAVAGLGVLNTVLLDTRERVHELGVLKALGMAPRQTVAMVLTSVAVSGLTGGPVGVLLGAALHHWILPAMARAAGTGVPAVDLQVFDPGVVVPLALGGLLLAVLGALPPAVWAARTRTARALRTE